MFWFYILTRIPLSAAYPVAILGSGLVPFFAWIFFRERLSPELLVGLGVMLLGLYIIQRGAA
jgi:drug/metabolite transporter (DMT)-like permease